MKKIRFFTSIELVVVLAIISLLLGLTTVYYFNFKTATALKLSAYEVAATLNQARSLAITNQDKYSVVFDLSNNKYEIQDSVLARIDEEHRLGEGIVFDTVSFIGGNVETYSATGTAKGGTVKIKDNKAQVYTLIVNGATGRVKVENN
ncbi:MAG: type II secretion system protein [Candidatus Omnitrophota bacterium]